MKTIGQILTGNPVVTLPTGATALEAARSMAENRVGAILVQDPGEGPVGMFTERDLMVRVVVPGLAPAEERIEDHMTRELYSVEPDLPLNKVAQEMQARHIRHLPVIRGQEVLGMLSFRDLLRAHLEVTTGEVEALTEYIHGPGEVLES